MGLDVRAQRVFACISRSCAPGCNHAGSQKGGVVEAVIIPAPSESRSGRVTVCISSQVGCAMNCQFCFTGRMGLKSNLTTEQIVEQVRLCQRLPVSPIVDSSWRLASSHLTNQHVTS
jgi:adenine C2-methylase RlmN of 23S rRNA A2503 and tRNA A37